MCQTSPSLSLVTEPTDFFEESYRYVERKSDIVRKSVCYAPLAQKISVGPFTVNRCGIVCQILKYAQFGGLTTELTFGLN
jgi:hypothetical protein